MIRLVRSEFYKLRTTPGPWVLVIVNVVLTAGFIAAVLANPNRGSGPGGHGPVFAAPQSVHALRDLLGVGFESALVLAPIAGVLCITGEYRHKVLTTTLLAAPNRPVVLVAKAIASMGWGLVLCASSLFVVAVEAVPWFQAMHGTLSALGRQVAPVIPGLIGAFLLLTLFGVGFGVLVKNQVAGVLLTIGGTLVIESVILAIFRSVLHIDLNWLPTPAASALAGGIFGRTGGTRTALLAWWSGGLVLLAWGVVPGVLGYFTTFRRDVT